MKTVMLLPLLLAACGPAPFIEPATSQSLTTSTNNDQPVACWAICERVRPQLERDFSVPSQAIHCSDFNEANTCSKCQAKFAQIFGVLLTQCP